MAVAFISYGYDTAPGEGLGELTWQEMHPQIGLATYGVRSINDWKVSAVSGADRTVSIAAGRGFGLGVIDKTVANDTIQLDPIASGSRWDLVACRRDPTPTGGESTFVKVNGGATMVIPGGRLSGPGIHDQPLALVQVTAGQSQPTGIIDLRTWVGDGGGLYADEDLVLSFMNTLGTRIRVGATDWVRMIGLNDLPEWRIADMANTYFPNVVTNWETTGLITAKWFGLSRQITVDLNFKRTGPDTPLTNLDLVPLSTTQNSLPIAARGDATSKYVPGWLVGGGNNTHIGVHLNPSTGVVSVMAHEDPITIKRNAQFSLNLTYNTI